MVTPGDGTFVLTRNLVIPHRDKELPSPSVTIAARYYVIAPASPYPISELEPSPIQKSGDFATLGRCVAE